MEKNSWISGPLELLNHGLNHINEGNEFDLRIGMISIDNAVEVAIKTYLSISRRQLKLKRKDLKEAGNSFPILLDCLEKVSSDLVSLEELDQIEQFHKLRNSLYHEGNGITIVKKLVEVYAVICKNLLSKLFDIDLSKDIFLKNESFQLIGEFLSIWASLEAQVREKHFMGQKKSLIMFMRMLLTQNKISKEGFEKFSSLNMFKTILVHGEKEPTIEELKYNIQELEKQKKSLLDEINKKDPFHM